MIDRVKYVFNVAIIAILFGAVAISRDARILGQSVVPQTQTQDKEASEEEVEQTLYDGTRVIYSDPLSKNVAGFAGRTPMVIRIKDGVVREVTALPNDETPSFFNRLSRRGLLDSWSGKSLEEALSTKVDVVSGATYSSVAVIENVNRALSYAASVSPQSRGLADLFDLKTIVGLIVILMGVTLTIMKRRHKGIEMVYMVLNVGVLGFWCSSFLSLAQVTSWMSNGFNFSLPIILLCVVVLMPIFGYKGSYCNTHCPLGSAQELLSRVGAPKLKIDSQVNRALSRVRYYIFIGLMFMMWIGVGFEIMDYELFTAFLILSAPNVILILAAAFLILSLFVKRPYCRFVCPTGAMISVMQKSRE